MQDFYSAKFIFKNKEFDVIIKTEQMEKLPKKIIISFFLHKQYEIQADVNEYVFKSFIKYFAQQIKPDIQKSNIDEFEKLNNELQIPLFTELIQYNREFYQYCYQDIQSLNDKTIQDKSEIEHRVSIHLNQYLQLFGHEILYSPIQSLYNIFSYQDCNFSLHELLFDLIQSHCEYNKNKEVFILLQFIDGKYISEKKLLQSFENLSSRFGFRPKFNISVLLNRIHELKHSKIITQDGLQYRLYEQSHIAEVSFSKATSNKVNVPYSINFQSQEYIVKLIAKCEKNENITSIDFPDNSEIKKINFFDINCIKLQTISIPSNVEEIITCDNNKLYKYAYNLCKFNISPNNKHFIWFDDNYLLGKTDKNDDILIFASRQIEHAIIPSNIKIIGSFCFNGSFRLKSVKFEENSKLQIIESNAFSFCFNLQKVEFSKNIDLYFIGDKAFLCTSIETIIIPPHVTTISDISFQSCNRLRQIDFSENSNLNSIGIGAFSKTSIENIKFPSYIKEIGRFSFAYCSKLQKIEFPNNCELHLIKSCAFSANMSGAITNLIKEIIIPQHVTEIEDSAFYCCINLQNVKFAENSELLSIGKSAFYKTSIETITIPPHVKKIKISAFFGCLKLRNIIFSNNSELQTIGRYAFASQKTFDLEKTEESNLIETIKIPSTVTKIKDSAFCGCKNLKEIDIDINSNLRFIGYNAFSSSLIETLTISSKVKYLNGKCFYELNKLYQIIISQNNHHFIWLDDSFLLAKSNQNELEYDILVFARRNIEHAIIPSYIKQIDSYAFSNCLSLKTIEFSEDSKLEIINESSFSSSSINTIIIPPHVNMIKRNAFSCCKNLHNIEFLNNSINCQIEKSAFDDILMKTIEFPPNFILF